MPNEQTQIYGLDLGLNAHETMTTEQILAAIERAITTGEVTDDFKAFIEMIKEQNKGVGLKFWLGTTAEFKALSETEADTVYLLTDNTNIYDLDAALSLLKEQLENGDFSVKEATHAETADNANHATSANSASSASSASYATSAGSATKATQDGKGRNIVDTYATKDEMAEAGNFDPNGNYQGLTAGYATSAGSADSAGTADTAGYATSAGSAAAAAYATSAGNAENVNDLEIKRDSNGVLKIGDTIIPQKVLLWSGSNACSQNSSHTFNFSESVEDGDEIEIYGEINNEGYARFRIHVGNAVAGEVDNAYISFNATAQSATRFTLFHLNNSRIFNSNDNNNTYNSLTLRGVDSCEYSNVQNNFNFNNHSFTVSKIYKIIE